mgnify:CR=1 FL=1
MTKQQEIEIVKNIVNEFNNLKTSVVSDGQFRNGDITRNKIIKTLKDNDKYLQMFYKWEKMRNDRKTNHYSLEFSDSSKNITKSLSKEEKKKNGIYFTPPQIIKKDVDFIFNKNKTITNILEPSCGSCEFINYLDFITKNKNIDGVEFNSKIYENIKDNRYVNNNVNIIHHDFLTFMPDKLYDLIIGNPPYFNLVKNSIPKEYHKYMNGRTSIYIIFILKCLSLLSKNGILSFVLPQNFLNCSYYKLVREKIFNEYTIININNHNEECYLETEQKTCTLMIQNKLDKSISNKFTKINMSGDIVFNTIENINKITELEKNTVNLNSLGFRVSVGNVVWNQEKEHLTNNSEDVLIIYSSDITQNRYSMYQFSKKSEKDGKFHYIKKSGLKNNQLQSITGNPCLVINRGYGNGNYTFNYALINENSETPYLVENHVICIKPKVNQEKVKLIELYKKIINSFNNEKTKEFVKLAFTNDAINCDELEYALPIYL